MDNSQKPDKPKGASIIPGPLKKANKGMAASRLATPIKPAPSSPSSPTTTAAARNVADEDEPQQIPGSDTRRGSVPVSRAPPHSTTTRTSSMSGEDVFEPAPNSGDSASTPPSVAEEEEIREFSMNSGKTGTEAGHDLKEETRKLSLNSARSSAIADDNRDDEVRRGSTNSARPITIVNDRTDDEVQDPPIHSSPTSDLAGDGPYHERRNGSYSHLSYGAPAHNSMDDKAEDPLNNHSLASPRASLTADDRSRTLPIESATTSPGASSATEEGATNSTTRSPTVDVAPASPETPGYGLGTQAQDFAWTHDYPIRHDGGDSVRYITAHVGDSVRYIKAFVTDSILRFFRILALVPLWYWSSLLLYITVALGTQIVSRSPGAFEDSLSQFSGQLINPIIGLPSMLLYCIGKLKSNYREAREYDCCRLPSPPPDCHCPMTEEESYAKAADYLFRVADESSYTEATEGTFTEETEQDTYAEATEDTSTTTKVETNHSEAMNDMFTMVTDAENDLIREVRKLAHITLPGEGPIADLLREYRIHVEPTGAQRFVSRLYSVREQIQQELYREAQYLADIFPAEGRIAAVLREFGMLEKSPHERGRAAFQASLQAFVDKLKSYAGVVEDSPSAKKGGSMRKAFMDKLRRKGSVFPNKHDAEHATAKALWDLLKIAGVPVKLEEGRYIYLNGHLVTDSTTWDEIFEMMKKGTPVNKSEFGQRWGNNYASNLKSQQGRGKSTSKAGEAYPEGQPFVASNTKRTGK